MNKTLTNGVGQFFFSTIVVIKVEKRYICIIISDGKKSTRTSVHH